MGDALQIHCLDKYPPESEWRSHRSAKVKLQGYRGASMREQKGEEPRRGGENVLPIAENV